MHWAEIEVQELRVENQRLRNSLQLQAARLEDKDIEIEKVRVALRKALGTIEKKIDKLEEALREQDS